MKWIFALPLFLFGFLSSAAQNQPQEISISWHQSISGETDDLQVFNGCGYVEIDGEVIPVWYRHVPIPDQTYRATISHSVYSPMDAGKNIIDAIREFGFEIERQYTSLESGKAVLSMELFPFRVNPNTGQAEKLISFQFQIASQSGLTQPTKLYKKAEFASSSVLSTGNWHKFRIASEGIYKIEVSDLVAMKIDPATVDASTYQIFGTEGGILPEIINDARADDLKELAIRVIDNNGNNRIDGSDQILFYAEGPHRWKFDTNLGQYVHETNFYDSYNYIFLTHSQKGGKRLTTRASGQGGSFDTTLSGYHALLFHERDLRNFIGSGREWFGESFGKENRQTFSHTFDNLLTGQNAFLRQRFCGRSVQTSSSYTLTVNGILWHSATINPVGGSYDQNFIDRPDLFAGSFVSNSTKIDLVYTFVPGNSTADAWLDYYELSVPVAMQFNSGQKFIYAKETALHNSVRMQMKGSNFELWDVTDYFNVQLQSTYTDAGFIEAIVNTGGNRLRFAAFTSESTKKPAYVGKVQNQNLHSLSNLDYVIVTHSEFEDQAKRLGEFHSSHYGYSVAVVKTADIFNEFGGGKKDATAIRDFLHMLYKRGLVSGQPLRYAVLFGDGTYDFKDRIDKNTNFIPTFQSDNSYDPSYSYGSDDYFAILDEGEGYYNVSDAREGLDIGVGRIPCNSVYQAKIMVDKILRYHSPSSFGEWRNRLTFLADDEDGNIHLNDSEQISGHIDNQNPVYNVYKIYLDAYQQESFGSGEKYPDVNAAIDRNFDRGHFIFNYLGHGGPSGMAHERVVTREQIRNWSNRDKMPVVITATCELTRYDDPSQDSPGELMLFDENGGAIALITTTRLVYINLNRDLNDKVLNQNMFDIVPVRPSLGDLFRVAKNRTQRNVNQRNFSLIGDPAMVLSYPVLNVVTTSVNDSIIGQQAIDTFKAFSKMKISGEVRNTDGSLATDFNGIVYPTMYDKYLNYSTLGNDPSSKVVTYQMQNSVLYRGKVSVTSGKFSFQFVVPKDIAYQYGKGKLVYYAENGITDGNGFENSIVIGGSSSQVSVDKKGPDIDLFIDDYTFIFGGLTQIRPLILCKIFDENGINTVGNGIGRDITAILDEGTEYEKILILNDFYQSTLDSYQEGELRYTMESLEPGRHTLKVRVWDVYNNASEDYTEFVVADNADLSLGHVLNYPNPFTTNTSFHFDHNKEGQEMDVQIQILSVSGKVVKTFHHNAIPASSHFNQISWDGRDAFGDKLARGVYLYKINVKSEDGTEAEAIEKLVLLN